MDTTDKIIEKLKEAASISDGRKREYFKNNLHTGVAEQEGFSAGLRHAMQIVRKITGEQQEAKKMETITLKDFVTSTMKGRFGTDEYCYFATIPIEGTLPYFIKSPIREGKISFLEYCVNRIHSIRMSMRLEGKKLVIGDLSLYDYLDKDINNKQIDMAQESKETQTGGADLEKMIAERAKLDEAIKALQEKASKEEEDKAILGSLIIVQRDGDLCRDVGKVTSLKKDGVTTVANGSVDESKLVVPSVSRDVLRNRVIFVVGGEVRQETKKTSKKEDDANGRFSNLIIFQKVGEDDFIEVGEITRVNTEGGTWVATGEITDKHWFGEPHSERMDTKEHEKHHNANSKDARQPTADFSTGIKGNNKEREAVKDIVSNDIADFAACVARHMKDGWRGSFTDGAFTVTSKELLNTITHARVNLKTGEIEVSENLDDISIEALTFSILFCILRRSIPDDIETDKKVLSLLPSPKRYAVAMAIHLAKANDTPENRRRIEKLLDWHFLE